MRYYFAPMEGLTDRVYRNLHCKYFPGVDRYYTPFFSPSVHRQLTPREEQELPLADTLGFVTVPQVLTKNAEDFLWMARVCKDRGYSQVNLNRGCPSGTVVAKGKGSGMLREQDALDAFLERICKDTPLPVSVKTRLGMESPEEFPALLEIFNRYPIGELTIHPRVRKQFYTGDVDSTMFDYAVKNSKNPLCYNGDILSLSQAEAIGKAYPQVEAVMIGRGLIACPWMLSGQPDAAVLEAFMDELLVTYTSEFGGPRNAMFRMKENWSFLHCHFENSEKLWKRLRKTTDVAEFKSITSQMFRSCELK